MPQQQGGRFQQCLNIAIGSTLELVTNHGVLGRKVMHRECCSLHCVSLLMLSLFLVLFPQMHNCQLVLHGKKVTEIRSKPNLRCAALMAAWTLCYHIAAIDVPVLRNMY